jgi:hypothetical protein
MDRKEALMKTRRRTAIVLVVLAALLTLALAPGASGAIDYSKNSATGEYAPATTAPLETTATADDRGFAWGDAAIGAGIALVLVLTLTALRRGFAVRRSVAPTSSD